MARKITEKTIVLFQDAAGKEPYTEWFIFGEDGDTIVVLLCGGTKGSQTKDIEMAKAYWKEYQGHGET